MEWTRERIAAFWEYWSERADAYGEYFTFQVGGGVAAFLDGAVGLRGKRVLDLGCGPGFLVPHLLARGAQVQAADASAAAVERANARFASETGWRDAFVASGARVDRPAGSFDVVCCVETLEHAPQEEAGPLLAEIARILAPGGAALITTPDAEDLSRSLIYCPACGAEFHKVQHLASWSASALAARLAGAGLEPRFCRGIDLARFTPRPRRPLRRLSAADLAGGVTLAWARLLDLIAPRPFPEGRAFRALCRPGPHLVALALRPPAAGAPGPAP
jgi:2-polyprenyl-3-methyl-5-hydroxy-6-metoxy-1,4-benzoquinol methylase